MVAQRSSASTVRQAPDPVRKSENWQAQAACKNWDFKKHGDPFFPVGAADSEADPARKICAACPVRASCLDAAMQHTDSIRHGVYGGTTGDERWSEYRRRQRHKQKIRKMREKRQAA